MDISASEKANEEFNSYFNFIRPSRSIDRKSTRNSTSAVVVPPQPQPPPLQISTDLLEISFTNSKKNKHDEENDHDDDIFKQLNYPHMKRPLYSPSSESSSIASSPQLQPTDDMEVVSDVTPTISQKDNVPPTTLTNKTDEVSPAASFLASFMTSPSTKHAIPPSATTNSSQQRSTRNTKGQQDTPTVIDEYNIGDIIGYGGFSTVRKAQHQKNQEIVAVKIINQKLMTPVDKMRLDRELSIWKSLAHPRIIQLKKIIKKDPNCYLICDYCSEGNLFTYLNSIENKRLVELEAKKIFKEICQGVYYLHIDRKVLHKDLKLENILLDNQGHIKICDFGFAMCYYQQQQQQQQRDHHHQNKRNKIIITTQHEDDVAGGSLAYASPEQIKQRIPLMCPKTDIWSLGVILYALVVGSLPFMDAYELRLQQKILEGTYDVVPTHHLSQPLQQLIKDCLAYETEKRLTIDQVLNSAWLKS